MMERAKPSSLIIMVELALPLLVAACAQPVMQSDKAPQQASDVTLVIGAQKLPPAPPSSPPAQNSRHQHIIMNRLGPSFFM
jgi:hypothetical protein